MGYENRHTTAWKGRGIMKTLALLSVLAFVLLVVPLVACPSLRFQARAGRWAVAGQVRGGRVWVGVGVAVRE